MKSFNLNEAKVITDPFPLIIYDNFIDKIENDLIYDGISKFNNFDMEKWGGRKQIRKESSNFNILLEKNNTIKNVYDFFNDKNIFDFFYKKFQEISKTSEFSFNSQYKELKFKKNYSKNLYSNFLNLILPKNVNSFLEMDFSQAGMGYFREPHHDKKTRLINFLLYFNDLDEADGGSLDIYGYKSFPKEFKAQPDESLLTKKYTFVPKKQQLIIFLSNPISIHGVRKIVSDKKRIFAYGSYTLGKDVNWILENQTL